MRKRTRAGNRLLWFVAVVVAVTALSRAPRAAVAKDKPLESSYALIAGTVFRDNGMSLRGAEVELDSAGQPQPHSKFKKMKYLTDARGEFAFRVPPVPGDYRLSVKAAGYQPQEKAVNIAGEERQDVFFRLEAASK